MPNRPLIGITTDVIVHEGRLRSALYPSYARALVQAGAVPVLLTQEVDSIPGLSERLDGFLFSGGDDPRTEEFGQPTDPRAKPMHPDRQRFEVSLLRALRRDRPEVPVLGVCLGMQLMSLVAGGRLDQHLPSTLPSAGEHWDKMHEIMPETGCGLGTGAVHSRHKQAVADAGALCVLARARDGVIEAVGDRAREFYVGVQWHPERTEDAENGSGLLRRFVRAATRS
ncbi:MAG: gamma-glutamyl-gamma-aminobutyrate hydrolase family protein [Phycisphaerales bacterium]|nr:gamma-glutamyl-gamma-aminobutyrate hydrolase family protein [Phycisphaerales bacterium]